ncbi:MAG: protein-glutamate O-methyltransferase CheR [Alphaproteobacteria bacterium]|nr:protein-glutamate O-methyltransferase CheR [Alphaproteobacteria bacterium]
MHIRDFDFYKDFLYKKSGLSLTSDKSYLLDSRLTPIARQFGYASLDAMTTTLRAVPPQDLVKAVVEAMTTNETSFFRDSKPFDTFRDTVLPYLLKKRATTKRLRIWSAACSSGQEAYSLAMLLKEKANLTAGWTIEIMGTDISEDIVAQAQKAEYSQFEVQRGLPIMLLMKYFTQVGDRWQLRDDIKSMVKFKYFNLLDNMAALGTFDIIFCRNVLIYFDPPLKKQVFEGMARQLSDDGFLFLGGAETIMGFTETFKPLGQYRGLYGLTKTEYDQESLAQTGS